MQERLQKIIAHAGIASRRHAEELIRSGQVKVNGETVRELGSKADAARDTIEVNGRRISAEAERKVYLLLNKPPEIVSSLADPEGRKTLRNLLRGFPERVYPVGNLEYAASGAVFLTNDGELAAFLLKHWDKIEQVFQIKVKGMLRREELARIGKQIGARLETVRQPDASRGHGANYWYEFRMRGDKKDELRNVLFREQHPVEKIKRVAVGPLTVEGIPRGRYRMVGEKEVEALRMAVAEKRAARSEPRAERPGNEPRRQDRPGRVRKNSKERV
jgi:23S rRNA pseudouridine2605 synthase